MPTGVNVSVTGCLFLCFSPATRWQPVQGVPYGSWDWLQRTRDPEFDKRRKTWAFPVSFKFATAYRISSQDDAGLFSKCYWNVFAAAMELKESDTCYKYIKFNFTAYTLKYTTFLLQTDDHTLVN